MFKKIKNMLKGVNEDGSMTEVTNEVQEAFIKHELKYGRSNTSLATKNEIIFKTPENFQQQFRDMAEELKIQEYQVPDGQLFQKFPTIKDVCDHFEDILLGSGEVFEEDKEGRRDLFFSPTHQESVLKIKKKYNRKKEEILLKFIR